MWVRSVATLPSDAPALVEALATLKPEVLAGFAQRASRDDGHLQLHLAPPVRRGDITTFHLRWWTEHDRSLTPSVDGEIELRPVAPASTELAITARYRCREPLRELADSVFLRRISESVIKGFLDSLVGSLEAAISAPALRR